MVTHPLSSTMGVFAPVMRGRKRDPTDGPGTARGSQGVGLLRGLLPNGEISVEVPEVEFDVVDGDQVTVTALPGLEVLVNDETVQENVATGITHAALKLLREDGVWRVENCEDVGG